MYPEKTLVAESLTKKFDGFTAVDSISFDLNRSEILGLIGPNGAGKTTTLQMLLNLTTPTAGEVRIFGLTYKNGRAEILKRVNFSSSYISLPYTLTVHENLTVFAKLYGVKKWRDKIAELLALFEITDLRDEPVRKLSSGQITRVCLCKSLLNDPEILFLDEPTASLDPDIADKSRALLKKFRAEKKTSIIYTSHNMQEMEELCDRVVFLDRGKIIASGQPEGIKREFKANTLEEVFLKIARG